MKAIDENIKEVGGFVFDDVTTDEDGHQWTQVCGGHAKVMFPSKEREPYYICDEVCIPSICGVAGCADDADYYLDFKD